MAALNLLPDWKETSSLPTPPLYLDITLSWLFWLVVNSISNSIVLIPLIIDAPKSICSLSALLKLEFKLILL